MLHKYFVSAVVIACYTITTQCFAQPNVQNPATSNVEIGNEVDPAIDPNAPIDPNDPNPNMGDGELDGIASGSATIGDFNALNPTVVWNWDGTNRVTQGIDLDDVDFRIILTSPEPDPIQNFTPGPPGKTYSTSSSSESEGQIRWSGREGQTLTLTFGTWDVSDPGNPIFTANRTVDAAGMALMNFGGAYNDVRSSGQTVTYLDPNDSVLSTQTFAGGPDSEGSGGSDWFTGYISSSQNIRKVVVDISRENLNPDPNGPPTASTIGYDDVAFFVNSTTPGDFNGDGRVDGLDFLEWQRDPGIGSLSDWEANFGQPLSANASAVPEPSALLLLLVGTTAVVVPRRRTNTCLPQH